MIGAASLVLPTLSAFVIAHRSGNDTRVEI